MELALDTVLMLADFTRRLAERDVFRTKADSFEMAAKRMLLLIAVTLLHHLTDAMVLIMTVIYAIFVIIEASIEVLEAHYRRNVRIRMTILTFMDS
ncbi:Hypothetical protein NTJ_04891 [Nesidiocoris tenuis]|uniref:Ion transport domain-containing protein n=1 Tax=Nesidiocoris tenuis TaxID=355587 RepID=A0ABN7AII9_9HEMI|nr:Hypothetical protein NTJ_04891 [Nesidiocoris tenuis]